MVCAAVAVKYDQPSLYFESEPDAFILYLLPDFPTYSVLN